MPVGVSTLVALIYNTGSGVIDRCKIVQQCPREAARIALRTQNVLGLLRDAAEGFAGNLALERSLLELREALEKIAHLVERCTQPARLSMRVLRAFRITATKESLLAAEDNLERVTRDLRLPLLTSVRAQLDEVLNEPSSAEAAVLSTRGNDAAEDGLPVVGERDEASSAAPECGLEGDELILETARGAIEEGMKTPTNESGGASIEEVIRDELRLAKSLLAAIPLPPALEGLFEEGHLGHGTFGVVVAGKYLGRDVAIKKARAPIQTAKTLQAFRKEAETQFVMRHPNIVETFAFSIGDAENPPCLVMERMQESLYGLLTHDYIIDFRGALDIILAVCEALRFLHTYNIVHSNVKSTNVLLGRNGTAKVSDFSLARVSATVNADTGGGSHGKVGGLYWTAPEVQAHRKATALSDIFSLHVVMWEAITNQVASEDLPIGERLLRAPNARLSLEGCAASTGPARSLVERAQSLLDRCGSIDNYRRPTINEIIPEIAALCNEATSTRAPPEVDGRVIGYEDTEGEARQQGLAPPGVAVTVAAVISPEAVEDVEPSPASVEVPVKMGAPAGVAAAGARLGSLRADVQETLSVGTSRPNVYGDPQQPPWLIPAALSATATEEPHRAVDHGTYSYDSGKGRPEPMSALAHVPDNTIGDSEDRLAEVQHAHAIEKVSTEENRAASTEITKKHGKPSGGGNRDGHGNVGTVDGDLKKAVGDDAGKPGLAGASCAAAGATAVGEVPGSVGWRDSVHGEPDAGLLHRAAPPAASAFAALARTNDRPSGYHDRLSIGGGGSSDSDAEETFGGGTRKPGSVTTANVAAALAAVVVKERPVAVPPRRAGGGYRLLTTSGRGLQQRREFFVGAALYNSGGCAGLDGSGSSTEQSDGEDFTERDDSDVITEQGDGGRARKQEPRARGNGKHDRAVLMVLFEQCRGRNWRHSENWGSGKPLSSWYNVTVDRGSHVKRIVLSRNRICGTLPADLGMLAFLEELRLHSNSLKGEIPRFIGGLRSLIHLDLHDNNLSGRIPKEIGNLGALESLDLSKNQLSGHIPEEIGDLTLLKTLVLRKNKLSGKIPPRLGALAGLESFDLSGNLLKGPIPAELGDLEALTELMIGRNRLGGEIPAELGRLSNLLVLELHDNQLSGNVPPELLGLRGLQHLELDGNDLQPMSGQTGDAPLHPMATKAVDSSVSGASAGTSESGRRRGTTSTPQVMPSATTAAVSRPDGNPSSLRSGSGGKTADAVLDDASSTEGPSSPDTPGLPYPIVPRALEQERSSHDEKGGQRGLLLPPAAVSAAAACDSAGGERVPDDPREGGGSLGEGASVAIVARFDSSPSEYCASDGSVRLRVRPGCLRPGQVAGPITLTTTPGCLVECGGHPYLISLVVDCQPSGATFDSPLDLDFRVGGELDEEDGWAGDRRDFDECFASLRDNTKVLQRDKDGDPWNAVEQGDTDIYHDGIAFFVRARVRHFSQVCLSKRVQLENAIHEDPVAWPSWAPPKRKQIGFVNATDGPLIFLVLPTSWSQKAIMSVAVGVAFEGLEARAAMSKAVRQSILAEATQPQILQVPCTKRRGNPRVGQAFPFATCTLPKATGGEARVALIRVIGDTVEVWDSRIVQQRTWVWVLPGQFSEGMMPLLGTHRRQDLAQGATCLMNIALMATAKGLQSIDGGSAPTSILSSEGGSVSTDGGDANSTG
ncbi:unnamed protein product [Scytosiphon promiscuus]